MPGPYTQRNPPPKKKVYFEGPGRTHQEDKERCDINNIMKRYRKVGVLPVSQLEMFYADVSEMGDYRTALHNVQAVQGVFSKLPSDIRAAFDNDPAAFLDFTSDPNNRAEMMRMGLVSADGSDEGGEPLKAPDGPVDA